MRIYVTPEDIHPVAGHQNDYRYVGSPIEGRTLTITQDRVTLDGIAVLKRDRLFRMEGHPWVAPAEGWLSVGWGSTVHWTGFTVRVEED